ncbi:MAG: hypothetical protein KF696_07825 [Planctomycetes bacterium]|nr:hypothetical protein [Planctomycetota bacterium]MCW8135461.1 hypothetical protein [Planctomycetota bacterium]
MALARILGVVLLCLCVGTLAAQAVGDPAANKTFLQTWNIPAGHDEVSDYQPDHVLILDWFGAT